MSGTREGPALEQLTRRLAETPAPFLEEPRLSGRGAVEVAALVHDLQRMHGHPADFEELLALQQGDPAKWRNPRQVTQLLCWLLADPGLLGQFSKGLLLDLLVRQANQLAALHPARSYVDEEERREELARASLRAAGLRPLGESEAVAADRWLSVSSQERQRLAHASRAAEERARQIREALARKAAEESADKWTRE